MKRTSILALVSTLVMALAGGPAGGQELPLQEDAPVSGGHWVAGDLHVHSTYSHDSYGADVDGHTTDPEELYTLGLTVGQQYQVAASRGLDFMALSDHMDLRSQTDPGFGAGGVIPIPAYENSLSGHAQMIGATQIYDNGDRSAAAVQALADSLRADGGVFQINHPFNTAAEYPTEPDWALGYEVVPDTIEAWNIARYWQPPFPASNNDDDAIRFWEGFLDLGEKVAPTGGSDSHWLSTSAVQGAGQPTTWVYVTEDTTAGVLAGLAAGRTFISHQPPAYGGAEIYLEADSDGDGTYESFVGDEVPPGSPAQVRVIGAPGAIVRVIGDGGSILHETRADSADYTFGFTSPVDGTWLRAEAMAEDSSPERSSICDGAFGDQTTYCRNQLTTLAMSAALYLREPVPVDELAASSLTLIVQDTKPHDTLAATLTDSRTGAPLAGRTISFTQDGVLLGEAPTGPDGVALWRLSGGQGSNGKSTYGASFAGDSGYSGSSASVSGR
jgi:hypothetical protein